MLAKLGIIGTVIFLASPLTALAISWQPLHTEIEGKSTNFRVTLSPSGNFTYVPKGPASLELEIAIDRFYSENNIQPTKNVSYVLEVRSPKGSIIGKDTGVARNGIITKTFIAMKSGNFTAKLTINGAAGMSIAPETVEIPFPVEFIHTPGAEQQTAITTQKSIAATETVIITTSNPVSGGPQFTLLSPLGLTAIGGTAIILLLAAMLSRRRFKNTTK